MKNFLSKIADFFRWIGNKLTQGGKWLVTGLLLLAIIITGILLAESNSSDDSSTEISDRPEVAQIFEPSIGTPLPPDTNGSDNSNSDSGENSDTVAMEKDDGEIAGSTTTEIFVAPPTGIDPNDPTKYWNDYFKATLPPGTKVMEDGKVTSFFGQSGNLLFTVSVDSAQSMESISQQLQLSPSVKNLKNYTFKGAPAVSFTVGAQSGTAVTIKGHTYYLTGNSSYFDKFSI